MELTHGIAMLFAVIFMIVGTIFKKMLWWLLNIGYIFMLAWVAIVNEWEIIFFPVLAIFTIIALIAFIATAIQGEII